MPISHDRSPGLRCFFPSEPFGEEFLDRRELDCAHPGTFGDLIDDLPCLSLSEVPIRARLAASSQARQIRMTSSRSVLPVLFWSRVPSGSVKQQTHLLLPGRLRKLAIPAL